MWTAPLLKLIQLHGADAVWQMGLEVLGYPPVLAQTGKEVLAITDALQKRKDSDHGIRS